MAIDFSFPEEVTFVVQKVREFCEQVVSPSEKEIEANEGNRDVLRLDLLQKTGQKTGKPVQCIDRVTVTVLQIIRHRVPGTENINTGVNQIDARFGSSHGNSSDQEGVSVVVRETPVQGAAAREMGAQKFHLVSQHAATLQVNILGMRRDKRYGQ